MQVVTKDGNYNAWIKLKLAIDLLTGAETETVVDVYINNIKALDGYKVTAVQSNLRPWPASPGDNKAEDVFVYLVLDTQEKSVPDQTINNRHITNIIERSIADSNFPLVVKVVPTQAGHNVMVAGLELAELILSTGIDDNGVPVTGVETVSRILYNPPGTLEFIWDTVVNPKFWEYSITK